jgi:hypothetical protein
MVCPFINSEDRRCVRNLKLDRIDYAVAVCGDDFAKCPVFWELLAHKRNDAEKHATPAA